MRNTILFIVIILSTSWQATTQHSIARVWNEATLYAIRNDLARPTIHARNLHHTTAAMYDAWAIFDPVAIPYLLGNTVGNYRCFFQGFTPNTPVEEARDEVISHAAYTILSNRFRFSVGRDSILPRLQAVMDSLGYNWLNTSIVYTTGSAAAMGNYLGRCYLSLGRNDDSNESLNYANRNYRPINPPLDVEDPGNPDILDLNRWQPLALSLFVDQSGNPIPGGVQPFLSAEWGRVTPFALQDSNLTIYNRNFFDYWVYHDPGPPPLLDTSGQTSSEDYQWGFELVSVWASHLDTADNTKWDISPGSIGNNPTPPDSFQNFDQFYDFFNGGDASQGHAVNPHTGQPYPANIVSRADYARVLAEFWADGPDSETPPGHWFVILNHVNDHPLLQKKFEGSGPELERLEWDIKSYFMLGGAMHDAAISAWGIKGWYDYVRPVSSIRAMAELGQRSDPGLPNYHPGGLKLIPGYIELITANDSLVGPNNEYLDDIKLFTWRGPNFIPDPDTTMAGVGWIRAKEWWPYQRPTFVTPNFAGYVSGHSTFSRAAAEILTMITGDAYFPGGVGEFVAKKNEFLVFEEGPSEDIILQWATYRDASDQTSLSRIWGGIHPPADDLPGRKIGEKVGISTFNFAREYFFPDQDQDGFDATVDCDDKDPNVYPGAPEICDDVDNNCDGQINEGLTLNRYFIDRDQDGYGDKTPFVDTCITRPPPGYSRDSTDCNDFNTSVNPGAPEICDRTDNNCDGKINEGLTRYRYYADVDRDGYGRATLFIDTCDNMTRLGFSLDGTDCDDTNPDIYPGAPEVCDNIDNDCDGKVNNGLTIYSYFEDKDGDGFGDSASQLDTCTTVLPVGYVENNQDCDDTNNAIFPGAVEICDNVDNNCDGQNNEGLTYTTYFFDQDNDGYGDAAMSLDTCLDAPPLGYVDNDLDCDDQNDAINPSATEICDDIDNNCDGQNNEGLTYTTYFFDQDNDGYGDAAMSIDTCLDTPPLGYVDNDLDCDDQNDAINPSATEICDDIDNNCDGLNNEDLTYTTYFFDKDNDGYGDAAMPLDTCLDAPPMGYVDNDLDCDDQNDAINPSATEICDAVDNNCDGQNNEGLTRYIYFRDNDGDGFGDGSMPLDTCVDQPPVLFVTNDLDCNDDDANINPDANEVCDDIDNNCNGLINDGLTRYTYYADIDSDGFGDATATIDTCIQTAPTGFVSNFTDCDDTNSAINPSVPEICDGIDNNCSGQADEGLATTTYYRDRDQDGFGDATSWIDTCISLPPTGFVVDSLDCDDANDKIYPGANDIPDNGIDEDCDGSDLFINSKIFPNPFMNQVTIHENISGPMTIIIQSVNAAFFREIQVVFVQNSVTIQLDDLPRGVYIVRGYHPLLEEVFVHKIIRDIGKL